MKCRNSLWWKPDQPVPLEPFCIDDDVKLAVHSDSFGNDSSDFPTFLNGSVIQLRAVGGQTLESHAQYFSDPTNAATIAAADVTVIAAGINDVNLGASLAQMQLRLMTIVNAAQPNAIAVFNLPPMNCWSGWDAAKESVLQAYNAWLQTITHLVHVIDQNSVLDTDNDGCIDNDKVQGGDNTQDFHPSNGPAPNTGMKLIAAAFNSYFGNCGTNGPDCSGPAPTCQEINDAGGISIANVTNDGTTITFDVVNPQGSDNVAINFTFTDENGAVYVSTASQPCVGLENGGVPALSGFAPGTVTLDLVVWSQSFGNGTINVTAEAIGCGNSDSASLK